MRSNLFLVCLLAVISTSSFSQKIPLINSGEVIEAGKVLYDSGKYAESMKVFATVPRRDTNYFLMLTEAALTQVGAEQYDDVLALCEKGLAEPTRYAPYFLRYQAIAEDKKGNFDRSVELFLQAIARYPTDYGLLYNLGITYYNNKQHEKAANVFFDVLALNPFHAGSHLNLGRIAIGQGRKVHGMLAMGMYLAISNSDNGKLVLLNNFLDNQVTDEGIVPLFGANEPEKLDQIIRAKIAMDKNFKSKIAMDAPVVRQFEMLFQQLGTINNNPEDRWIEYYLPIYQAMAGRNVSDAFIYHILTSSPNTSVKKWLSKNEKTLTVFYETVNSALKKHREVISLDVLGFDGPIQAWHNDNNTIAALGEYAPTELRRGPWKFFYSNYQLSAEGNYSDEGKKAGIWKYYNDDGTLKSVEDHGTGEVTAYYRDGAKREHFYLKDDNINGEVELFYWCGALKEKLLYSNDQRQGKGQAYHTTGEVQMTYEYKDDKANGEFRSYYPDGSLRQLEVYKNGVLEGKYESYFANGKPEAKGGYLDGKNVGEWTHYYSNGRVSRTGKYTNEGLPLGEWLYYDEEGNLTEKRSFDEAGRLQGSNPHYFENKLHYTDTYKKDVLIQSVFVDPSGKELARNGSSDGTFAARNYFTTGQLQSEGNYRKGKMHGPWKTYNRFGKLLSEFTYADGQLQGKGIEYFPSGEKKYGMEYKDNELHGYFTEYYRHGQVKQEGWFQNGNREQQWLTWFPDGTLETDSYYRRNNLTGTYYTYFQDGVLYSQAEYENNILKDIQNFDSRGRLLTVKKVVDHVQKYEERFPNNKVKSEYSLICGEYTGKIVKHYPDGKIYYAYDFRNGKKQGRYIYNDAHGKMMMEGSFLNDEEEGLWKNYYSNGKISKEGPYRNGLRDSVWTYYFSDGTISSVVRYRKDEPHGISRYYSPEGAPLIEKMYLNGDLLAWRPINTDEENSTWIPFSGTAAIAVKNADGTVVYEETYKDGLRDGHKRLYFNNGKLHEEYQYSRGDFEGPFIVNYANGKVRERGVFKNDELQGKVETFNPDGTPLAVEQYNMGTRHGKATYFSKGAKKEYTYWDGILE